MMLSGRRFLLLQGPHGPFFAELAAALRARGACVLRLGVNAGDESEWRGPGYLALRHPPAAWPDWMGAVLRRNGITDLLLYGEARPLHQAGLRAARLHGVRTHILEEGYLRPHWITYERQGSNGNSPATGWPVARMAPPRETDDGAAQPRPQASWGALRQHAVAGARYHLRLMAGARRYPHYRSHRARPVRREAAEAVGAVVTLPLAILWRAAAMLRLRARQGPVFVLLLQLEHDATLTELADLACHDALLERCLGAFAGAAPREARLVVKMHPLETRRLLTASRIRRAAVRHGLSGRVLTMPGGRLAPLLDRTCGAVTLTSTAGQQALWRGQPLLALGRTVYSDRALVPQTDPAAFFARPLPPDPDAHARLRAFLLRTSQVPGSFYARKGRAEAIAALLPRLAADEDLYDREAAPIVPGAPDRLIPRGTSDQLLAAK